MIAGQACNGADTVLHGSTGRGYVTHAMRKAQCTAATHRLPSFTSVNHTCRIGWSMPNTRSSSHRRPHSDRCALSSFSVCGTSVSLHNGTCWLQGRLATEGATRNVRGTCVEKMSYDTAATRAHHRLALIPNLGPMSASRCQRLGVPRRSQVIVAAGHRRLPSVLHSIPRPLLE